VSSLQEKNVGHNIYDDTAHTVHQLLDAMREVKAQRRAHMVTGSADETNDDSMMAAESSTAVGAPVKMGKLAVAIVQ
jgi:hypothetical protein